MEPPKKGPFKWLFYFSARSKNLVLVGACSKGAKPRAFQPEIEIVGSCFPQATGHRLQAHRFVLFRSRAGMQNICRACVAMHLLELQDETELFRMERT